MPLPNRSHDGKRFTVSTGDAGTEIWIYDDDFGYDATMKLTGDWSDKQKHAYAEAICGVLNFHETVIPTPETETESSNG